MADVQLEHGYTKIANEILDVIQHFQFTQNQYKLLMALWRNTYGWNRKECEFSLSYIESVTHLERKRVSEALKTLIQNNVIRELNPGSRTKTKIVSFNKNYEEWTIKHYKGSGVLPTSGQDDTSGEMPPRRSGETPPSASGQSATHKRKIKNNIKYNASANSAHEGNSDGVPTTDPIRGDLTGQAPVGEISHIPQNDIQQLLNGYVQLRNKGLLTTQDDFESAKEILAEGVSLNDALIWLKEKFDSYQPKHPRDHINSLSYCVGHILDRHIENQEKERNPHGETGTTPIHQYRGRNGGSAGKGKSKEQLFKDLEAARDAWGG
ncbi:replication protein [Domibacillus tundrae]|uniref:replication protein n=1 Tax=Domibacillus tundrae TaxID=1587527 RepID=UPI000617ABF2|nr:replication protein [Domibacillus tundrae]